MDQLLSHIRDMKTRKEASENLKKIFAVSTTTPKLKSIWQRDMSVTDYTNALGSINVMVDEDKMVQIYHGVLVQR